MRHKSVLNSFCFFVLFCFVFVCLFGFCFFFWAQLSRSPVRAPGSSLASSSVTWRSHSLWSLHLQPLPHDRAGLTLLNDGFYLIRRFFRNLFNNHAQNWMQAPHARICSLPQLTSRPWMISAPMPCYGERCSHLVSALLSPSTFSFSLSPPWLSILILISLPLFVPFLIFSSIHSLNRHWASAILGSVLGPGDTHSAIWMTPSPLFPQSNAHSALKSQFKPQHPKVLWTDSCRPRSPPSIMARSGSLGIR